MNKSASRNKRTRMYQKFVSYHKSRVGWRCESQRCHNQDTNSGLALHHIQYLPDRYPWDYDQSEILILCFQCHQRVHKVMKEHENQLLLIATKQETQMYPPLQTEDIEDNLVPYPNEPLTVRVATFERRLLQLDDKCNATAKNNDLLLRRIEKLEPVSMIKPEHLPVMSDGDVPI